LNKGNRAGKSIKELQIDLAKYLIQVDEGKRLPSIRKLAASTQMSLGSVSTALNELQDMGAVEIQKRGHLGSIVAARSIGTLWNLVEQGPLVIAMTLPMHARFEGLATGIKRAFENAGIEAYLIFIRGSRTRLKR
jgi:DNA-binding transcriptional MocR family regulator